MKHVSRRQFFSNMRAGALVGILGPSLLRDLGLASAAFADDEKPRLQFGELEALVALIQETPMDRFLSAVVREITKGTSASKLVAAAALANARAFGGEDYVGFHALMALTPAYVMAGSNPRGTQWLPILKVLYRSAAQMHANDAHDTLLPLSESSSNQVTGEHLRDFIRKPDVQNAEAALASLVSNNADEAFNQLQHAIQDDVNVHRVVLAWRAWSLIPLTGAENALTMLRQSVRFCIDCEQNDIARHRPKPIIREILPKLMDHYKLEGKALGMIQADAATIDKLANEIHHGSQEQAAETAAGALSDGLAPSVLAEAMAVAANRLLLTDPGRIEKWSSPNKPPGSVHGDSVGVHASDAANAWRHIAGVGNPRTCITSLIVGAFHTGGQKREPQEQFPHSEDVANVRASSVNELLGEAEFAIRNKDQRRASAVAQRYIDQGHAADPMFDLLSRFAVSEDGALHAEKYFHTAKEEYGLIRPEFRGGELVALARVTASQFGYPAPGLDEATKLLSS